MVTLKTPQEARQFLLRNSYELSRGNDSPNDSYPQVTYVIGTGNKTWEGSAGTPGVAAQNNWVMREKGKCCISQEKTSYGFGYCGQCGNGVNKNVSWIPATFGDGENFAKEMLDLEKSVGE